MKCELYHDSFQNWKSYPIQKAQLIIADIPYTLGDAAYGSNPMWYVGGDNKNGESKKAGKAFFNSDYSTHALTFGENLLIKSISIRCGDDFDLLPGWKDAVRRYSKELKLENK